MSGYDLIKHDDPWREFFGGIECLICEAKVPYGAEVFNDGGTNDYMCVACEKIFTTRPK